MLMVLCAVLVLLVYGLLVLVVSIVRLLRLVVFSDPSVALGVLLLPLSAF